MEIETASNLTWRKNVATNFFSIPVWSVFSETLSVCSFLDIKNHVFKASSAQSRHKLRDISIISSVVIFFHDE